MQEHLQTVTYTGTEISELIPELGQLRIQVFRDFPYLYEGSLTYEKNYLKIYTKHPDNLVFGVKDQGKLVGATTGMPLLFEAEEIKRPFIERNIPIEQVFYFGESILLPTYRGKGFGHQFFDVREEHALQKGYHITAFCSVVRSENHPLKPVDYRPNDVFWMKRGYEKQSFTCKMNWLDLGQTKETEKELQFWMKVWK